MPDRELSRNSHLPVGFLRPAEAPGELGRLAHYRVLRELGRGGMGMVFEAGGDWQLARFKKNPANAGKVMDRGLWRYTRHPNYVGEFCVWWGFALIAFSAGAWWAVPGPVLISFLLLRVSGVSLLAKDIGKRRPQYADYVLKTNAFFPGPPRN